MTEGSIPEITVPIAGRRATVPCRIETIAFMAEVSEKVIGVARQLLPERFQMVVALARASDVEMARIVAQLRGFLGFIVRPMVPA